MSWRDITSYQDKSFSHSATAVAFGNWNVCIVTMICKEFAFELAPQASGFLPLFGEDQSSLQGLFTDCFAFCQSSGLKRIFVRGSSKSQQFPSAPLTLKVETILQMMPGIAVELVHPRTIHTWMGTHEEIVPGPELRLKPTFRFLQQRAIDLAAYAYASTFPDQSE